MSAVGNRYAISRCSNSAPLSTATRIAVVRATAARDIAIGFQEVIWGGAKTRLRFLGRDNLPLPVINRASELFLQRRRMAETSTENGGRAIARPLPTERDILQR